MGKWRVIALLLGDFFGFLGGALITVSFVPQIIRVFKLRSARELSLLFTFLILFGAILWLAYGIFFRLTPVIIWNSITAVLVIVLIMGKLRYGRQ